MTFQIKHYIEKSGERFSLLYGADERGIPLFYPTAFAARSLRMDKTHATQLVALESIRRLCEWERDRLKRAVAEAECNTVTGLKQVHHAATPLPLS
jgi:hypothetical protein